MRSIMPSNGKTLLYVYTGSFTDLPNGAYYTGYAQWANIYSIMNGVSGTTFGPNESITRQDICVMLYRYLTNYVGRSLSAASSDKFSDDAKISSYARDAVYAMQNIGVVGGYSDVANHFAAQSLARQVFVPEFKVAQVARRQRAVDLVRFARDPRKNFVVDCRNVKSFQGVHFLFGKVFGMITI